MSVPVRVLIVDDDERERIVLRYILEQIRDVEIVGEAVNGREAILLCQEKKVNLVFLDISMPELSGCETAKRLTQLKDAPLFAFITIKKNMAVLAFELGALDYIIKPIEQSRIEKTIARAKFQVAHKDTVEKIVNRRLKEHIDYILKSYKNYEIYSNKLPIREKGKISFVNQSDIIYCESQGKKVYICTTENGYLSNYTLNTLENRLDENCFFRVHQAFIVNLNYIRELINLGEGSYILHMIDCDKDIILSRSKSKLLRGKMGIQ
jgi:two-component system LytT family response regulator/two-component system response regulator LytT